MVFAPYPHQLEALAKMRDRRNFALLMGMRTGKSKVTIDDWVDRVQRHLVRDLVVIAPAGVYRVWQTELNRHVPEGFDYRLGIWESGANTEKKNQLQDLLRLRDVPRVLLMNVEALSSAEVRAAQELIYEFMVRDQQSMLVVDESTVIKNPASKRTFAVCALGQLAASKRILSGLPTPRSPLDAYAQFAFLDPRILGYYGSSGGHKGFMEGYEKFFRRHAVTRSMSVGVRRIKIVVGYRDVEEIHEKIQPYSYRKLLRDCSDVPDKLYLRRDVELTGPQRKAYNEMKSYMTTQLESGDHVTAGEVVTCMLRLHQICCGHVSDELGVRHEVKTNRLHALYEVLEEYDGKAVVWCSYDYDVRAVSEYLRQKYGDEAVAQFWGGNADTREEDNRRFQEDPDCRYMVATPSAGGRGRNWSVAKLLVYYSNTDNLEHRDQSEERGSAVVQGSQVTVVDLIARGTVEEKIVSSLRNKIDLAATITGDDYRNWIV